MGVIFQPLCKCGSEFPNIFVGGGFMNFDKECLVPTPCYKCGTIFTRNILLEKNKCPKCRRIVHPLGVISDKESDKNPLFSWDIDFQNSVRYELEDKMYKCPVCLEDELTFADVGCWD